MENSTPFAELTLGLASDHAGFELKSYLIDYLTGLGCAVQDFGTDTPESMDYPDVAHPLARALASGNLDYGIALCGTGNGMAMTLNKHPQLRAALCWDVELAGLARAHNNANCCVLPARFLETEEAREIVETFLTTSFDGGRHSRRVEKIPVDPLL